MRLGAAAVTAVLIWSMPVMARAQDATYSFDIPAQGLGDALRAFGQIAHQQIIFSEDAVRGKRSPRLQGSFTVDQALRRLLVRSGLTVRRTSNGVIYIESVSKTGRRPVRSPGAMPAARVIWPKSSVTDGGGVATASER